MQTILHNAKNMLGCKKSVALRNRIQQKILWKTLMLLYYSSPKHYC